MRPCVTCVPYWPLNPLYALSSDPKLKPFFFTTTTTAAIQARRTGSLSTLSSLVCADGSRATASSMAHASTEALTSTGLLAKADMSSVVAVVTDIYRKSGVLGFYPTFTATLARNIPSAVIRFTMYEEIRSRMVLRQREKRREGAWLGINCGSGHGRGGELTVLEVAGFVLAGSAASAFASTCCTPLGRCHVCAVCTSGPLVPLTRSCPRLNFLPSTTIPPPPYAQYATPPKQTW